MTTQSFRPRTNLDGKHGPRCAIDVAAGHAVLAVATSYRDAAKQLGVSHQTLRNFVARFGKAPYDPPAPRVITGECDRCDCKTHTSDYATNSAGVVIRRPGTCRRVSVR